MVKIPCYCMICQNLFDRPCGYSEERTPTERNIIDVQCPHSGGTTFIVNQGFRYELWAEDSIINFIQRDYALSVSCISTALERFNEAFCKWCLFEFGLGRPDIERSWKEISKKSERQWGALSLARAILSKQKGIELPALPSDRVSNLRNDVVHAGRFPTEEEAETHATSILQYIFSSIKVMQQHTASLQELAFWEISLGYQHAASEIKSRGLDEQLCTISTLSFPYRLALRNKFDAFDFAEIVETCRDVHKL